jgi:hypothetical protein
MRRVLELHPDSRCEALTGIEVEVARLKPRRILLRFILAGAVRHVRFPRRGWRPPRRMDGLWRHTCFEAFLRSGDEAAYHEFNLSPSGDWAAWRFSDYRRGRTAARQAGPPGIDPFWREGPQPCAFAAVLELERLVALPLWEPWHLGLAAVIEERNGRLSYWALRHPPGPPDFHHPDCFALELAAARPA